MASNENSQGMPTEFRLRLDRTGAHAARIIRGIYDRQFFWVSGTYCEIPLQPTECQAVRKPELRVLDLCRIIGFLNRN